MTTLTHRAAALALALALAACGDDAPTAKPDISDAKQVAPTESSPRYAYEFAFLGTAATDARKAHIRRALDDMWDVEHACVLEQDLRGYGLAAHRAWFATKFLGADALRASRATQALLDVGAPPQDATPLELAFATMALARARHPFGMPALAESERKRITSGLIEAANRLVDSQRDDGTWGDPIDTAWAQVALLQGSDDWPKFVRERIGDEWRGRSAGIAERWRVADRTSSLPPLQQLHLLAAVALAGHVDTDEPWTFMLEPEIQARFQRELIGFVPDGSPGAWFATGFLWEVLGPSKDPDHPLLSCKSLFRDRYQGQELVSHSPSDTLQIAAAVEWFGYDDFGSIWGYLPNDNWPPLDDR